MLETFWLHSSWILVFTAAVLLRAAIDPRACRRTQMQIVILDVALIFEAMTAITRGTGVMTAAQVDGSRPLVFLALIVLAAAAQRLVPDRTVHGAARLCWSGRISS